MRNRLLFATALALCGTLHAESRSCHSEWRVDEVDYQVNVRLRLDPQVLAGFAIETFVSWKQGEEDAAGIQVFSAYVNTDTQIDETITVDDDHGARRFRLHPGVNEADDDTVVRIRRQGEDYVVDVDRVSTYHRGMAPFPRHAVVGVEGADCQVKMFDP